MEKWDINMMEHAEVSAKKSYCKRLQVGAIIARDGRILVDGYNGTISGLKNECEEKVKCSMCKGEGVIYHERDSSMDFECYRCNGTGFEIKTSEFVVHAEQNAIFFAAKYGIPIDGCTMYITHNPCKQCSKAIASSGIKRVVYKYDYRDTEGLDFLSSCGVKWEKLS